VLALLAEVFFCFSFVRAFGASQTQIVCRAAPSVVL